MKRLLTVTVAFSFCSPLFVSRAFGQPPPATVVLEGTVRDLKGNKGVPDLTMRLIPPNNVNSPMRMVRTDGQGNFRFSDQNPSRIYRGRYFLEIYQDDDLLFRKEIDTNPVQNRRILVKVRVNY